MREHEECDAAYSEALAHGRNGYAEYLLTRCDQTHGRIAPTQPEGESA